MEELKKCIVFKDGPFGKKGHVFWLCPGHAKLVDKWNDGHIKNEQFAINDGKGIAEAAWKALDK